MFEPLIVLVGFGISPEKSWSHGLLIFLRFWDSLGFRRGSYGKKWGGFRHRTLLPVFESEYVPGVSEMLAKLFVVLGLSARMS